MIPRAYVTGPMVWFQKFEYAMGHWLQKATEHMIGCVLCSPGCFSLFRAKALMDDNVIGKYKTRLDVARHIVQCDQGKETCRIVTHRGATVLNLHVYVHLTGLALAVSTYRKSKTVR